MKFLITANTFFFAMKNVLHSLRLFYKLEYNLPFKIGEDKTCLVANDCISILCQLKEKLSIYLVDE